MKTKRPGAFSRRNLLRSAAGFTLAMPWLETFAQTATPPRRIVFVFTANGDQIARRMLNKHETQFVFDDMLSPFEPWRSKLLVLDGIHKYHNRLPAGQRADGHQQGGSALAPWPSGSGSFPIGGATGTIGYVMGPSADRAIGERVQAKYPSVPYRHLSYRVGDRHNDIWNTHSHAGPVGTQAPIPPETDPFAAYTRIFGNLSTTQSDALKRRIAMRQSSLDLVQGELASLKRRVSTADGRRIDQHAESILEIERGLVALQNQSGSCTPLTLPARFDPYVASNYKAVGFLYFKMIALAFACDLTRAVQFNWSGNTSDRIYSDIGLTEGHHSLSHLADATAFTKIRAVKKNLFNLSCQLHTELQARTEAGTNIFENTLVVHWSELSQGDTHQIDRDLVVLAGGAGNHFRMGRYLDVSTQVRRSFSDVLTSCFHYMGFTDVARFGYPDLASGDGPLPYLT